MDRDMMRLGADGEDKEHVEQRSGTEVAALILECN